MYGTMHRPKAQIIVFYNLFVGFRMTTDRKARNRPTVVNMAPEWRSSSDLLISRHGLGAWKAV